MPVNLQWAVARGVIPVAAIHVKAAAAMAAAQHVAESVLVLAMRRV